MGIEVRDGTWKTASNIEVRDGGSWKQAQEIWVRDGGTWKSVWTSLSPPDPPQNTDFTIKFDCSGTDVTWDDPATGNPDNYELQREVNGGVWNVVDNNVSGTANSYEDLFSISNGDDIRYRLRACNSDGCSDWDTTGTKTASCL